MLLILSSAYCEQELAAELGMLPPSFLPVGNKRLYEHQCINGRDYQKILLSLPEDFHVSESDTKKMTELGIELLRLPTELSLGEAVLYCINAAKVGESRLDILYGDTLILEDTPLDNDQAYVAMTSENYGWHYVDEKKTRILCGRFSFSNASELCCAIARSRGDFISALSHYSKDHRNIEYVLTDRWLDFGHIHTYFRSKVNITTQRNFNKMRIDTRVVTKTSSNVTKMRAEANWFEKLPRELKLFTPAFLGTVEQETGYRLEYLHLSTLSDLFVYGRLPLFSWQQILDACSVFLEDCARHTYGEAINLDDLFLTKTLRRLDQFQVETGIDINAPWRFKGKLTPGLREIALVSAYKLQNEAALCLIHGDFCFSNILYDFRAQTIKVIDPRGLDAADTITQYGDARYDIGKLAHSVLGLYDFIIAGNYSLQVKNNEVLDFEIYTPLGYEQLAKSFGQLKVNDKKVSEHPVQAIMIHLFLSMLPLHGDRPDRQKAFVANVLRIWCEIEKC
jgi:hypothetical protein